MIYLATSSGPTIDAAIRAGLIGRICTPNSRTRSHHGPWGADNGVFTETLPRAKPFDAARWMRWLARNADVADRCVFAALPDRVGDWPGTLERSAPWAEPVAALGYTPAIVLQDGATAETVPWEQIGAVFVGGTDEWKLGADVRALVGEAKRRGLWAHMGRVNSERRFRYASHIGCDSADGTFLSFGPDVNLERVRGWLRGVNDQGDLLAGCAP